MMFSVVTPNLQAPSCRPFFHRCVWVHALFIYIDLLVSCIVIALKAVCHVFVSLAEAVLRAGTRPPAPSETGAVHLYSWRQHLPPGATGTLQCLRLCAPAAACKCSSLSSVCSISGPFSELHCALPPVASKRAQISQRRRQRWWWWWGGGVPVRTPDNVREHDQTYDQEWTGGLWAGMHSWQIVKSIHTQ